MIIALFVADTAVNVTQAIGNVHYLHKDPLATIDGMYSRIFLWGKFIKYISQFIGFMILLFMFWGYGLRSKRTEHKADKKSKENKSTESKEKSKN